MTAIAATLARVLPDPPRPRLLPLLAATLGVLALVKAETLWQAMTRPTAAPPVAQPAAHPSAHPPANPLALMSPARAASPAAPAATPPAAAAPEPGQIPVSEATLQAERGVLEGLRARRGEIEARERAVAAREAMLAAAELRLTRRVEELVALQQRLEALEQARGERDEAGWRGLVKLYEGMRPRDAARIFDELEMPVLVQLLDRMREAKASPVIGAMTPERARQLTAELARHRSQRLEPR